VNSDRPEERPAVRTTIVGGRPPGSGKDIGEIPRGIEVLVSKASVDAEFRAVLLERRAKAAESIDLKLSPTEAMMLDAIPAAQLEAVIDRTKVSPAKRRAFLGTAAAAMLAALGVAVAGCDREPLIQGIQPDRPPGEQEKPPKPTPEPAPTGIRPDMPPPKEAPKPTVEPPPTKGIRPDRPAVSRGVRPERLPITDGIRPDLDEAEPKKKDEKVEKPKIQIITGIRAVPEDEGPQ